MIDNSRHQPTDVNITRRRRGETRADDHGSRLSGPSPDWFVTTLTSWYRTHGRDLPWRRTRDPYAILVSEVMLQQTQVARVIPRYTVWLERWPTTTALAAAPTADVIAAWTGLGYNRRAVNLQRACAAVAASGWPTTTAGLRQLPGIGPYTADALRSLAFGAHVIPTDVNIARIAERVDVPVDQMTQSTTDAAELTQALFDLGATVCIARRPRCHSCPLAGTCPSAGRTFAPARRQGRFEGSRRQARARVVRDLVAGPRPLADVDRDLIDGLVRDGLVVVRGEMVSLP